MAVSLPKASTIYWVGKTDGLLHTRISGSTLTPPAAVAALPTARLQIISTNGLALTVSGSASTANQTPTSPSDPTAGSRKIVGYQMSWGDGTTTAAFQTSSQFTHTYAAAGTYAIMLNVKDSAGQTAFTVASVTVTAPVVVPNSPPKASWVAIQSVATPNLGVDFDGTSSTDSDGTIAKYSWAFGDGGVGTGATITHVYAAAGTYSPTLTVTDDKGATNSLTIPGVIARSTSTNLAPVARLVVTNVAGRSVTVDASGSYDPESGTIPALPTANQAPTASFVYTQAVGGDAAYNRVNVDASASTDPDGTIASYNWDFTQSTFTSTAAVANGYYYTNPGTYNITLTVTDDKGAVSAPVTKSVTVTAPAGGGTTTTTNGDSGINQTGTSGFTQTGTGVVAFSSLSGASITAKIKTSPSSIISFASGTFSCTDFAQGIGGASAASGNNSSGIQLPSTLKGVYGAGSKSTTLQMTTSTSTKSSTVPAQSTGSSNQLQLIDVTGTPDGFIWDGLNVLGTAQGHLYNGLRMRSMGNTTFQNSTFGGVPGNAGSPPGETFTVNMNAQSAGKTITFSHCTFNGAQGSSTVAAVGLGTNNTAGTININDCYFNKTQYSAAIAIWELAAGGTINIRNSVIRGCHRNIGNEAQGGTINIYDPLWDDPPSGEDDIRVTWTAAYNSGAVNVYFTKQANYDAFFAARTNKKLLTICTVKQSYGGSNTAYTGSNDIRNFCKMYIAGVQQTQANVWTFTGSPKN